jgi:predicted ferric reductase
VVRLQEELSGKELECERLGQRYYHHCTATVLLLLLLLHFYTHHLTTTRITSTRVKALETKLASEMEEARRMAEQAEVTDVLVLLLTDVLVYSSYTTTTSY